MKWFRARESWGGGRVDFVHLKIVTSLEEVEAAAFWRSEVEEEVEWPEKALRVGGGKRES